MNLFAIKYTKIMAIVKSFEKRNPSNYVSDLVFIITQEVLIEKI